MPVGAPLGNTNGKKARLFEQALIRAIKQRDLQAGEGATLRAIAEALLDKATAGDLTAIKESRDTLDGKPAQQVVLQGDEDNPLRVEKVVREIVKP